MWLRQPPSGILQTQPHLGEIETLDSSPTPAKEADIPVPATDGSKPQLLRWGQAVGCARTSIQIRRRKPGRAHCRLLAKVFLPWSPPANWPWGIQSGVPNSLFLLSPLQSHCMVPEDLWDGGERERISKMGGSFAGRLGSTSQIWLFS